MEQQSAGRQNSRELRLAVVAQEIPYPPTHGGRVDMWRRLKAFARAGVRIQLFYWSETPPDAEALAEIGRITESSCALSFKQGWGARLRTAGRLFSTPAPVSTRLLNGEEQRRVMTSVLNFQPDAIWLDQLYGAGLAMDLVRKIRVPMLTRSHNVEHCYWREQIKVANSFSQKIRIRARLLSLEHFEEFILRNSYRFYDISVDDLRYWQQRGLHNGQWLPPLAEGNAMLRPVSAKAPEYDIGFLGNLFMPNNVEAVNWLLDEVLPRVRHEFPLATVLIAGSRASDTLRTRIAADPLIELRSDVPDPVDIYRNASVLVNPMLRGSGVALKSIDMLAFGRSLVSTSQGMTGLPPVVRQCFMIGDTAEEFSKAIVFCLRNGNCRKGLRSEAVRLFSDDALNVVIDDLHQIIASQKINDHANEKHA
jgi:hypothetical protein